MGVMKMIGVLVNVLTVILGSTIGILFKKGIPEKITKTVMIGLGLCVIYIGVSGALKGSEPIVAVICMAVGGGVGSIIDIDKQINRLGDWIASKFNKKDGQVAVAEGFVGGCLMFCVGAMTIVGSLNSGLGIEGGLEMIYTKSVLDLVSSAVLAASLGYGVIFSAIFVFVFQGGIVLLSEALQPFLTSGVISELTCVGSLMIIGLGLNMVGATKIKVANYIPSLLFVPLAVWIASLI